MLFNNKNNFTSNNDSNKPKKNFQLLFFNLTQKNIKEQMLSKKNNFKIYNKKKLTLNKDLTLGNSSTCKNIFSKNIKINNNNNLLISNFNLYKINNNRSNLNIFNFNNNDKLISTKRNEINTLNQKTCNYNLKYKDLLYLYNNNILNKKRSNKYLSMRNRAIIFTNLEPKNKKRISSSITNRETKNIKSQFKQEIFNNKSNNSIKSKSSTNFYKNTNNTNNRNKNENKIKIEINVNN